jgi:hypothetical protein
MSLERFKILYCLEGKLSVSVSERVSVSGSVYVSVSAF